MPEALQNQERQANTLRDILYVVFRHKVKSVSFFLFIVFFSAAYSFVAPEVFLSEAKLMVRVGRESVALDPTATTGETISLAQTRENEINSELEIIRSRELAEKIVDAIGVEKILNPHPDDPVEENSLTDQARNLTRATRRTIQDNLEDAEDLLARMDLIDKLERRNRAITSIMDRLSVSASKRSSIIELSCEAGGGWIASAVLEKLIDFYLEKHIEVHRTTGSYVFFQKQVTDIRLKLDQAELDIRNFLNASNIISIDAERQMLTERLKEARQDLAQTERSREAFAAKVKQLRERIANMPEKVVTAETTGMEYDPADELSRRLSALRLEEQDLLTRYKENSTPVKLIRQRILTAENMLATMKESRSEKTTGLNESRLQAEKQLLLDRVDLAALEARETSLRRQIKELTDKTTSLNTRALELQRMERERSILEQQLIEYTHKLEQARIEQSLQLDKISNISVVQSPTKPMKPIRPRKIRNIFLGFVFGLIASVLLAFLAESLDRSFRKPEEIEKKIGCPVFASIPLLPPELTIARPRAIPLPASMPTVTTPAPSRVMVRLRKAFDRALGRFSRSVPSDATTSMGGMELPEAITDYYETVRDRLTLAGLSFDRKRNALGIVSCRPREGVTTIAVNLATMLAKHSQHPVLLVDANLQRSAVHKHFDLPDAPGLADEVLFSMSDEEIVKTSQYENLDIVTAGSLPLDFSWIAQSETLFASIAEWKQRYQCVIFDLPSIYEENSVARFAESLDAVLFCVEAEMTRYEVAQRAMRLLEQSNTIGAVFNKRRQPIPAWAYRWL